MSAGRAVPPDDERRHRILDAAAASFAAYGFARTTMKDVAAAAGISRPTLYQAYPDKTALFLDVAQRYHDDTAERCRRAAGTPGPLQRRLAEVIVAKLDDHLRLVRATPHGRDLLDLDHRIGAEAARAAGERFHRLVAGMLRAADGTEVALRPAGLSVTAAATLVVDSVNGLESSLLADPPRSDGSWRRRVEALAAVLVRGMAANAPDTTGPTEQTRRR